MKEAFAETEVENDSIPDIDSIIDEIPEYSSFMQPLVASREVFERKILYPISPENKDIGIKETCFLMGIYIANIGYARHYGQVQVCMDYMAELKFAATKLSVPEEIFNNVVISAESNLNEKEKLFMLVDSVFINTSVYLKKNELYGISAIIASGLWLETYRIGMQLQLNSQEGAMIKHIELLDILTQATGTFKNDTYISSINKYLIELKKEHSPNLDNSRQIIEHYKTMGIYR